MENRDRPTIVSVNVGLPRTVEWRGRQVTSAIWKEPVSGPVTVAGVNLDGDDQADRRVHGGPDKAVYAYASEDYDWWAGSRGPLAPGTFGENLTTAGIDLAASHVGDRWAVGSVLFEVAQPRQPCFKLGIRMGDDTFPDLFDEAKRPGAYLRIVRAGSLAAGDLITVDPARRPAVSLATLVADDPDEAMELFEKYGVFNHREMHSRYEIALEQYLLSIGVEARTTLEMANTVILPAALRYQTELATNVSSLTALGIEADTSTLTEVSASIAELRAGIAGLRTALAHGGGTIEEEATHAGTELLPAMDVVRTAADTLETLVADDLWPLATYQEMLFIL